MTRTIAGKAKIGVLAVAAADRFHGNSPLEHPVFGQKHLARSAAAESCLDDKPPGIAAH